MLIACVLLCSIASAGEALALNAARAGLQEQHRQTAVGQAHREASRTVHGQYSSFLRHANFSQLGFVFLSPRPRLGPEQAWAMPGKAGSSPKQAHTVDDVKGMNSVANLEYANTIWLCLCSMGVGPATQQTKW